MSKELDKVLVKLRDDVTKPCDLESGKRPAEEDTKDLKRAKLVPLLRKTSSVKVSVPKKVLLYKKTSSSGLSKSLSSSSTESKHSDRPKNRSKRIASKSPKSESPKSKSPKSRTLRRHLMCLRTSRHLRRSLVKKNWISWLWQDIICNDKRFLISVDTGSTLLWGWYNTMYTFSTEGRLSRNSEANDSQFLESFEIPPWRNVCTFLLVVKKWLSWQSPVYNVSRVLLRIYDGKWDHAMVLFNKKTSKLTLHMIGKIIACNSILTRSRRITHYCVVDYLNTLEKNSISSVLLVEHYWASDK